LSCKQKIFSFKKLEIVNTYLLLSRFHVVPGYIKATFLYLAKVVPKREERLKYGTICFDELDINRDCDIDRYTDEPINPECKKDGQIMQYRQIAGKEKLPFFVDIDHAVTPDDVMNSISMFKCMCCARI
jgi:hypothetical protein